MKRLFKKNKTENATNYQQARAFAIEDRTKENTMDELVFQRIGKSRQEIFDLMKILKAF
ncbi:MAG TPA: hypothetical protein VFG46_31055 [Chryseolinea sp.]|nr:hypothetical protein [Chryseolinea sp.]